MAYFVLLFTFLNLQPGNEAEPTTLLRGSNTLISRNWTVEDGLPVNSVNEIIQDEEGFIWFTTYDGIVRFDGINFKVYTHSNTSGMRQNRAVFIHEQEGTGIWVTLENSGVVLINDGKFKHFDEANGFISSDVKTMLEDSKGRMWFGTYKGVFKYENGTFSRAFTRNTPEKNRINKIYEVTDGSIWATTHDGVVQLKDDAFRTYSHPGGTSSEFTTIMETRQGELWLGTRTGLMVYRNGKIEQPVRFNSISREYVTELYQDQNVTLISTDKGLYKYTEDDQLVRLVKSVLQYGSYQHFYRDSRGLLWMVRNNGELAQLEGKDISTVKKPDQIADYYFNRIIEDREGTIWLTTARNGLVQLNHSKVQTIGKAEGLVGGNILGLYEDSRGRFWVGSRDKGLNIINGDKVTHLNQQGVIPSNIVHSIAEDYKGNIWVGYYQQGLQKFSVNGNIKRYNLGYGSGLNDVHTVFVSADSTIWVGTYGGLIKLDPENENHTVYTIEDGLAGNLVRYIDEDSEGGLWIATADGGVSYFKEGSFTNYGEQQGLASNNIRSVYVDEYTPETIWVGTENNGLSRIRGDNIVSLGVEQGLPDHIIHYISQDRRGWLWMSSNRGVFKINKKELNTYLDGGADNFGMIHYGRADGMKNPECNGTFQQGGLRTSNGTFWFATQEGIAVFDIEPEFRNEVTPKVYVKNIAAEGKNYTDKNIEFDDGVDDFKIDFHALTYVNPDKTRFRYMLVGYDEGWTEAVNTRHITYNDVPAGNYTFRVSASNSDGVWATKPASASIEVSSLFYQRPWFYALAFILLGIGFYGASRLRYNYLMRRQKKMQEVIDKQTAKLRREKDEITKKNEIIEKQSSELEQSNKAKDRFLSIIGHDLRNPFQALIGYSSLLVDDYESMDQEEVKNYLQQIDNASQRLLNLVQSLLNWASLQTERVKPKPEYFLLNELIEKNIELLSPSALQKEIMLQSDKNDVGEIYADRNMIDTIVRNLISNAIKFTERSGDVLVSVFKENETCYIKIADTGIGMPPQMVDKLMDLDKKTSRFGTEQEEGTGLGLVICKDMAELHQGEIHVESEEGVGTTFTVRLPKNGFEKAEQL